MGAVLSEGRPCGNSERSEGAPPPGARASTGAHLASLIGTAKGNNTLAIIRAAYQDPKSSQWLSGRTGVPAVALPLTVGGDPQSKDLFGLFDSTIDKLLGVAK